MKLSEIASRCGLTVLHDGNVEIVEVASLEDAKAGSLTFAASSKYAARVLETKASAILLGTDAPPTSLPTLHTQGDVMLAVVDLVALLHPRRRPAPGIHPTAVVAASARIGPGSSVGPFVVVEDDVTIGKGAEIEAHTSIGRGARIGDDAWIHTHVTIRPGVRIGDRVVLGDGAVLGGDGFGFAHTKDGRHVKMPHIGTVVIGDDVEIQQNACVDRATLGVTRIGNGVKIDNFVQLAHNCTVGDHTLLCAGSMFAGSTNIGRHCVMAGQVGTAGHQTFGDGVQIAAQSGVHGNLPAGTHWGGSPAFDQRDWVKSSIAYPRLPGALRDLKNLIKRVELLEKGPGALEKSGG